MVESPPVNKSMQIQHWNITNSVSNGTSSAATSDKKKEKLHAFNSNGHCIKDIYHLGKGEEI